jgi:hypothetical protein
MNDNLVQNIKSFIDLDNEINERQKIIKELKNRRKETTNEIKKIMKENNLDNIETSTGDIKYVKNNVKKTLNIKDLKGILLKYNNNQKETNNIIEFLDKNREIKTRENIKFNKN